MVHPLDVTYGATNLLHFLKKLVCLYRNSSHSVNFFYSKEAEGQKCSVKTCIFQKTPIYKNNDGINKIKNTIYGNIGAMSLIL